MGFLAAVGAGPEVGGEGMFLNANGDIVIGIVIVMRPGVRKDISIIIVGGRAGSQIGEKRGGIRVIVVDLGGLSHIPR